MHSYLILIYKESIFDTPTYKTLIKMLAHFPHAATLYIWDNSPTAKHSEYIDLDVEDLKVSYFHSARNENLSIVYNQVMKMAFNAGSDYLTLLDQDSYLPKDFKSSIGNISSSCLLLPKVCSDKTGEIISPRYQRYNYLLNNCNISFLANNIDAGIYTSKSLFAVGSGMTIPKALWLTKIKFRECLSFYGVDTEFCVDYSKQNEKFILLGSTIKHNASNEYDEGYAKFKWRLIKYYEHWRYQLYEHSNMPNLFIPIYVRATLKLMLIKNKLKRLLK